MLTKNADQVVSYNCWKKIYCVDLKVKTLCALNMSAKLSKLIGGKTDFVTQLNELAYLLTRYKIKLYFHG